MEPGFVHSSPAVLQSRTLLVICLDSGLLLVRNRRLRLFHVSFSVDNDYGVKAGQCIDYVKHKAAVIRRLGNCLGSVWFRTSNMTGLRLVVLFHKMLAAYKLVLLCGSLICITVRQAVFEMAISSSVSLHHHSAILVCKQVFLIKSSNMKME